jgi:hypothetical protein
MCINFVDVN